MLLPNSRAAHATSWIYVFGIASVASLTIVVCSGMILTVKSPGWWHDTDVGRFFSSVHLWAVVVFFFVTAVHLGGQFWTAAWRGGRAGVWVSGAVALLVAVPVTLTGYISRQNFDAQWAAIQAKDLTNSIGAGAFFNPTDFGQMYRYHVLLLPVAVVALAIAHVLLVLRHGALPRLDLASPIADASPAANESGMESDAVRPSAVAPVDGAANLGRRAGPP